MSLNPLDPRLAEVSEPARILYRKGIIWSAANGTKGAIPWDALPAIHALPTPTDEEVAAAWRQLRRSRRRPRGYSYRPGGAK